MVVFPLVGPTHHRTRKLCSSDLLIAVSLSSGGEGPKEDIEAQQDYIDSEKYSVRLMRSNPDGLVSSTSNWQRQRFHNPLRAACGLTCMVADLLPSIHIVDNVNEGKLIQSVIVLFFFFQSN